MRKQFSPAESKSWTPWDYAEPRTTGLIEPGPLSAGIESYGLPADQGRLDRQRALVTVGTRAWASLAGTADSPLVKVDLDGRDLYQS